uniref:Nanos-type domain-containing protein n=1 Tax=Globodera rostochiensis TaxID=31243 RepID=A0A914I798_GLORO
MLENRPSPLFPPICEYCKQVGKPAEGHLKTGCPVIYALDPCRFCGAAGYNNHTAMHCPNYPSIELEHDEVAMAQIHAMHKDDDGYRQSNIQATPNNNDEVFGHFMNEEILRNSPSAFSFAVSRRIASTPAAMPSSQFAAKPAATSTAKRRLFSTDGKGHPPAGIGYSEATSSSAPST